MICTGDKIYRIRSYRNDVYVEAYTICNVSPTGRLISNVPEGVFQGTKPTRIHQFNQMDQYDFLILSDEQHLFRNLNFFLRKYEKVTGGRIKVINFEFELDGVLV